MSPQMDATAAGFLLVENRTMPMHVGGLQLFRKPEGAGRNYAQQMYDGLREVDEVADLFLKHPHRSVRTGGLLTWQVDHSFDIEHHVRHSALPKPGRVRELLDLVSRLHSTRLAWERPLWEAHLIEGLRDGRIAVYTKTHHALMDGVSAMRLLQSVLSTDPEQRDMPAPWARRAPHREQQAAMRDTLEVTAQALRQALGIGAEAAGLPGALFKTLGRGVRNETSSVSFYAPRTIFNQTITGSRRFAAQDWPVARLRAVSRAAGVTLNDVVLAMCSGAMRAYLTELGALPDISLVAMVPIGLKAKSAGIASGAGGNAVGSVMVKLGTDLPSAEERLQAVHESMVSGKRALTEMTQLQIVAMSALGQAPAILAPALGMHSFVRPPYNLVISNVPGPRSSLYLNGARLEGMYPLSVPINGMALNITCASYDGKLCFGITGCRRTVPHLQRMLGQLDDELVLLEKAAGA